MRVLLAVGDWSIAFVRECFEAATQVETWLVVAVLLVLTPGCTMFDPPPAVPPEMTAAMLSLSSPEMEAAIRDAQRAGPKP